MAEVALAFSILALIVAFAALLMAAGTARAGSSGPRPNVLLRPTSDPPPFGPPSAFGQPSVRVVDLINGGRKIEAIKEYRMETGAGLKEAKDAVEAYERGSR